MSIYGRNRIISSPITRCVFYAVRGKMNALTMQLTSSYHDESRFSYNMIEHKKKQTRRSKRLLRLMRLRTSCTHTPAPTIRYCILLFNHLKSVLVLYAFAYGSKPTFVISDLRVRKIALLLCCVFKRV